MATKTKPKLQKETEELIPFSVPIGKGKNALVEPYYGEKGYNWIWKQSASRTFKFDTKENVLSFFEKNYKKRK